MKIAITGGAGLIGSHIARAYGDAGHDVLIIDNLSYGSEQRMDPRARLYKIDIRDEKLCDILQHERPEILSHHAVQPYANIPVEHALADADLHIRGLLNVLDGCVQAGIKKFIFASNGNGLYEQAGHLPVSEEQPICPKGSSDICKAAGEWYVRYYTRQYGLKHTILRYADVYAEYDPLRTAYQRHPLNYFIDQLIQNKAPIIRGTGEEARDHIFIEDVVQANLCVLNGGKNQTFHISSGRSYSLNQLYQAVARQLQYQIAPTYISGRLDDAGAIALDNTRARLFLEWQPVVTLEEGIARAVRRVRNQQANVLVKLLDESTFIQTEQLPVITRDVMITS